MRRLLVISLALIALSAAPAAWAREETPAGTPPAVAGDIYVGLAEDGATAVALLVGQSEARAYFCDGRELSGWLVGSRSGDGLLLQTEEGVEMTATLANERITGAIRFGDGTSLAFRAEPATGIAGLYDATVAEDGRVTGRSTDGLRIVGAIIPGFAGESRVFVGIIELPDGGAYPIGAPVLGDEGPTELRLIVQADGRLVGSSRTGNKSWLPSNF